MRKVFSKIDLKKGYHQIPMNPCTDIPKTGIITPFILFEDIHMTLGLRNMGNTDIRDHFQWPRKMGWWSWSRNASLAP